MTHDNHYSPGPDGILRPPGGVIHPSHAYDEDQLQLLLAMQRRHFWYRGRHRFLLHALRSHLPPLPQPTRPLDAIDLGGGCGGWINYLQRNWKNRWGAGKQWNELALADSSTKALQMSATEIGPQIPRYQIDLLNLHWQNRWDVAFLLDVIEHIQDAPTVMQQIFHALRPGGLLLLTAPALQFFWSHNDLLARHVKRYTRTDLAQLATTAGFDVRLTRYFMFLLSPLLFLARRKKIDVDSLSPRQIQQHLARTHRVPFAPLNELLALTFAAETPLGLWLPFPWGTSVLGVFRKPPVDPNPRPL